MIKARHPGALFGLLDLVELLLLVGDRIGGDHIILTLLFLGLAFRQLYLVPQVCAPGTPCADPTTIKRQRLIFWIVGVLLLGLLAVPLLAPLFY